MALTLFADESGTSPAAPCYRIGALKVSGDQLDEFNKHFGELHSSHGLTGEVKWKKVAKGHGLTNFAIDMLRYVIQSDLSFSCIVVLKSAYRKWQSGSYDEAFYTTYSFLLRDFAQGSDGDYEVLIDNKTETYDKHDEALHVITNRMLNRIAGKSTLASLTKGDSKAFPGIQAADLLTGAVNAAHILHLDPSWQMAPGKKLLLARLAATLGWTALHFDTWPNQTFNIWHFPFEDYRAVPATVVLRPKYDVPYITAQDLKGAYSGDV